MTKTKAKGKSPVRLESNSDIIQSALAAYPGKKKASGTHMMIQCPFHDDNSPSAGVVTSTDLAVPLGWFNCLGCGAKGPWNMLAEKIDAPKIKGWNSKLASVGEGPTEAEEDALLGTNTSRRHKAPQKNQRDQDQLSESTGQADSSLGLAHPELRSIKDRIGFRTLVAAEELEGAQPWPVKIDWRGYPGSFLRALGPGVCLFVSQRESINAYFVVWVHGRVRGGVRAMYEKSKSKQPSYITSKGSWVLSSGLLFFDLAKRMIDKFPDDYRTFVVLCEGPRDALRLLSIGIPAVACLGALTFSKQKALSLMSIADQMYVMTDNDAAGSKMWRIIDRVVGNSVSGSSDDTQKKKKWVPKGSDQDVDDVSEKIRSIEKERESKKGESKEDKSPYEPAPSSVLRRIRLPVKYDENDKLIKMDPHNAPKKVMRKFIDFLDSEHGDKWRRGRFWAK